MRAIGLCGLLLLALAACGGGDRGLRNLDDGRAGPDEFRVLPNRPLDLPDSFGLPEPTPGGVNRADPNPTADAIAALGGSQAAAFAGGIPAGDAALVAAAARNGVPQDIRAMVAAEDAAFRRRAGTLAGVNPFGRDRYFRAYAGQALDAYGELDRFRALGIAVPTAPPRAE